MDRNWQLTNNNWNRCWGRWGPWRRRTSGWRRSWSFTVKKIQKMQLPVSYEFDIIFSIFYYHINNELYVGGSKNLDETRGKRRIKEMIGKFLFWEVNFEKSVKFINFPAKLLKLSHSFISWFNSNLSFLIYFFIMFSEESRPLTSQHLLNLTNSPDPFSNDSPFLPFDLLPNHYFKPPKFDNFSIFSL